MRYESSQNTGPPSLATEMFASFLARSGGGKPAKRGRSMSSVAGSRAKTSALPDAAAGSTARSPASGWNTPGSFAYFDPGSWSWRTPQLSLVGGLTEFLETWPHAGTTRNGIAFRRRRLVPLTSVTGFTLWATPTATLAHRGGRGDLIQQVRGNPSPSGHFKLVPTPTVNDARNSTFPPSQRGRDSLIGHIMRTGFVSTPTASRRGSYKTGRTGEQKGGCRNLSEDAAALGSRGELNPPWVEWLMGFPIGWTDLGGSETPSSPKSPSGSDAA